MEAYLDNAATTMVAPEVAEVVNLFMTKEYGNPSSKHSKGAVAAGHILEAKKIIAKTMKVEPKEIVFTSGGTESNNMALIGGALANRRRGNHIISTRIEHASVYNPLIMLQDFGFRITFLPVDSQGRVSLEALKEALDEETILVSVMMVNNEIGAVEPVEAIGQMVKGYNPEILYHIDAIQGYGKLTVAPKKCKADLVSVSGHKIHGPKGSGFLYIKDKTKLKPLILGGGQQKDMRSGTENVPGIMGLAKASQMMYDGHRDKVERLEALKQRFLQGALSMEGVTSSTGEAPHIISLSFSGIEKSEVLLHALEAKGVYCSSGSACSSNHPAISGTLQAIGLEEALLSATLRFSLSIYNTEEEIDYSLQVLAEELERCRRFCRR